MIKIYHAVRTSSGDKRAPKFPEEYALVATVNTVHLGAAFMLTQNSTTPWVLNSGVKTELSECRSTSIGDVLELNGEYYRVEFKKFSKIEKRNKWLGLF